jgi:hypothetical protein
MPIVHSGEIPPEQEMARVPAATARAVPSSAPNLQRRTCGPRIGRLRLTSFFCWGLSASQVPQVCPVMLHELRAKD